MPFDFTDPLFKQNHVEGMYKKFTYGLIYRGLAAAKLGVAGFLPLQPAFSLALVLSHPLHERFDSETHVEHVCDGIEYQVDVVIAVVAVIHRHASANQGQSAGPKKKRRAVVAQDFS